MTDANRVRAAFVEQADWCNKLGSPFTARVCESIAQGIDADTEIGREILRWPGNPSAQADALPLRVAGALHALARNAREPALASLYPPAPLPSAESLWHAIRASFELHAQHFRLYLANAPQTNEVGRSAVLIAGFLELAARFRIPMHLFEIGASAGLNLVPDRYRYRFGATTWGDAAALVELAPNWTGRPPPVSADFRVASRHGSDIAPLDISATDERDRLLSYVWADQSDRLSRLQAAITTALRDPPHITAMDAADWVELSLPPKDAQLPGTRVLFHSVLWRYLPDATQRRIEARVTQCGAAASLEQPFAWLRFELDDTSAQASLTMTAWPPGDTVTLASSQPHGRSVIYLV